MDIAAQTIEFAVTGDLLGSEFPGRWASGAWMSVDDGGATDSVRHVQTAANSTHRSRRAAFDAAVVECLPNLQRLAMRLCGDEHMAEDIVHDAIVKAARSWRRFRGDARVATWLHRIVINASRDAITRRRRERDRIDNRDPKPIEDSIDDAAHNTARNTAGDDLAIRELRSAIADAVGSLSDRQREVFVLIVWQRLSVDDAADVLNTNRQNVHANLHLARRHIRCELERLGWIDA